MENLTLLVNQTLLFQQIMLANQIKVVNKIQLANIATLFHQIMGINFIMLLLPLHIKALTNKEASYSCTETFVGSSNELVIRNDKLISNYSEWTNSGSSSGSASKWLFSDVNKSWT